MTPTRTRARARELAGQLAILAAVLWTVALVNVATPTRFLRTGQVKGTDFVQFYALGRMALSGEIDQFADRDAIRRTQLTLVPESESMFFPALYGPQVPLALAPLALLTYEGALIAWTCLTVLLYAAVVLAMIRISDHLGSHRRLVLLGAAAFPPFWQLVQHGQLTVVAIVAVGGAWWSMSKGRPGWAGAWLGLLAYKLPLLAPVVGVVLLAGARRMLLPLAAVAAAQYAVALPFVGLSGLERYATLLVSLPGLTPIVARPEQVHAWRGFWDLLFPGSPLAAWSYVVTAGGTILVAAAAWRRRRDAGSRMAALSLAVALSAPYLYVYDLALLAPAWIWLVDRAMGAATTPRWLVWAIALGYLAPLVGPVTALVRVQASVPIFAFLLLALWRRGAPDTESAEPAGAAGQA